MNWYYAEGGSPRGPVTEEDLERLVQVGRIRSETLVWREGMADWQTYAAARATVGPAPPVAPGLVCSQCGRAFTPDEMIRYGGLWVCAACKPAHLQGVREGITSRAAPLGRHLVTEEELLARACTINIGDAVERGWKTFSAHTGLMLSATALLAMCALVAWVMSVLLGLVVPLLNGLLLAMINGLLMGGMVRLVLAALRGQPVEAGMVFSGFGPQAPQLMLCSLVQAAIGFVFYLPLFGVLFSMGLLAGGHRAAGSLPALGVGMLLLFFLLGLVALAAVVLLSTIWVFSIALIVDKGYRFWPAMRLSAKRVRGRLGMTLLFLVVAWLLYCAGALACLVGVLITFPLYVAMKAVLYEDNFRDLMPPG